MTTSVAAPNDLTVNQRIFRAASSVALAGIAVKCAATLKEIYVAGLFGRSDQMDAFLAAFLIPNLLVNLISESMNQALVPTLIRVRMREGMERAQQLLSNSMLCMCGLLTVTSVGMAFLAHEFFPLIGHNFSAAKLALSLRLFYALLPIVLLTGIASTCTAVLNSLERFTLPTLAAAITPLSIIAGIWLLPRSLGIWAVVYATLIGSLIYSALMAVMMSARGYQFRLRWWGTDEATREVAHQYGPVLLSSVVASSGLLVDQAMAAMLPPGSVSALVFANRFVGVVLTLLAGAISSAVVPYFSTMIAQQDWIGCRQTLKTWSRLTALVSIPIAAALIVSSHSLIRMTLQHGAFGPRDTTVVTAVLAMYAIQIPFYVVSRVFYRFLVAMRRTDLILYCGIINLALDIVLNLWLMRWLGVAGIALATSLWTVSTLAFLWFWSNKVLSAAQQQGLSQ